MKGSKTKILSVIIAGIMVLMPAVLAADSPTGAPADKVTRTTSKAMPAGAIPAGATITGITTTGALLGATVVILGTGAVIAVGSATDDDEITTSGAAAAHHSVSST